MNKPFDRLKNACAITLGDYLMPGVGVYPIGAVACVMPDEATAKYWLEEFAEDLASLDRGAAGPVRGLRAGQGHRPRLCTAQADPEPGPIGH